MNRIQQIFFTFLCFIISISIHAQIDENKRYDEDEVAVETEFVEASRQLVLGQYEKAIEIYEKLLKKDGSNPTIHFQLSRCHEALKNYDKAISFGEKSVKLEPNNEFYTMQLAESYEANTQFDKAAEAYLGFASQRPKDPFFYERAVFFYLQNNDEVNAISTLKKMEKNLGVSENVSRQLHEIYDKTGDQKNAAKQLENLVKKYPKVKRYQLNLANYYVRVGEHKKADKLLAKLDIKKEGSPSSSKTAGSDNRINLVRAVRNEIPESSISIDNKITKLIPLLQSLNDQFNEDLGEEILMASQELISAYPDNPKAYALLADVYFSKGETDKAIESYEQTIKLNSSVFDVWFQLMNLQKDQDLIEELNKTSDQAILRFPNQAIAYLFNGYSLNRKNQAEDAFDILQEAVFIAANNQELIRSIHTEMAYSKMMQNEYAAAMQILDTEPIKTPAAYELRGDIFAKQNKGKEALENWKKALELVPSNKDLQTKIQNSQS